MKFLGIIFLALLATGCQRTSSQTWEDVKTAGRYVQKGFSSLWGGESSDSRIVASEKEFMGPEEEEFIPLNDQDLNNATSDQVVTSTPTATKKIFSKETQFVKPNKQLSDIFRTLHFSTDDHVVYEKFDLITVARVANYLKAHPYTRLMIEGHCDQRASADYNFALGTRRANHIRVLLMKQGVKPQQIMTASCGKEKPIALGNTKEDYELNRRVEFKIYEKQ